MNTGYKFGPPFSKRIWQKKRQKINKDGKTRVPEKGHALREAQPLSTNKVRCKRCTE